MPEIKPGRYRHFKGGEYEALYTARHSETGEEMIVYRALYGERGMWVRPAAMWSETVRWEGRTMPRFTYLGEEEEKSMLFLCYSRCTTCRKAQAWLDEHGVAYAARDIKTARPTAEELKTWRAQSGLPLKRLWNTSGIPYRELGVKDKLPAMSEEEQLNLLATDGMLVKRPILIGDGFVLVGFDAAEWAEKLSGRGRGAKK